jgi:hypothetical protein
MLRIEKAIAERDYERFASLLVRAMDDKSITSKAIFEWDVSNAHIGYP